jgi:hypothetical protein
MVVSRLIMSGIRAFIKMKQIESLLLPTNAFHPFYGSFVKQQKLKRSRFPFGFYNSTRIFWSIRHVKILTMLVARPDYRSWIIGALPFNSLSLNGKVFRSIVRQIKKCNLIPSKKFANQTGSIRFIEMLSKKHSIRSLAMEAIRVLAMHKHLENGWWKHSILYFFQG